MPYHLSGVAKKSPNKEDKPKYVAVVPVGQKFVKATPESSTKLDDRVRLAYRLLFTLDDALRTLMKRRGELSMYVLEVIVNSAMAQWLAKRGLVETVLEAVEDLPRP